MRTLRLYRFRYFDELRQRWIRARYVMEAPAIRCRYPNYELIRPPEIRSVQPQTYEHFTPFRIASA